MKPVAMMGLLLALLCAVGGKPQTVSPNDQRITDIAARSACARYRWKHRGFAPVGYIKGMALMYAKSFCDSRGSTSPAATVMKQPLVGREDALVRYQDDLARNGVDVNNDIERLRAIYTLAVGEGMRESSGNTTEGRDIDADQPPTADNAEAGLFQQSFDSFGKSTVFAPLFEQYKANTGACRLEIFKEGIPKVITRPVVGSGPGAEFQRFTRDCPAFATEYAIVLFRVNQRHFGPVRRHEAEYFQPCNDMLKEVESVVTCTP